MRLHRELDPQAKLSPGQDLMAKVLPDQVPLTSFVDFLASVILNPLGVLLSNVQQIPWILATPMT